MTRPDPSAAAEAARRKRLAALGGVLPDATQDEAGEGWGDPDDTAEHERDLLRDVPPHHG